MNIPKYNSILLEETKIYSGFDLNRNIVEGRPMAINKKYLAMSSINVGEIAIFDSSKSYKIKNIQSQIKINNSKIQDIEFSPFNDNILALAYENKSVVLWKIPEGNINKNITKDFQIYKNHNTRVNYVTFNPVVDNILCSDSLDNEIHIWNIDKGNDYIKFKIDENPSMISWNQNGDLIGVTSRKNINIFDPRNEKFVIKHDIFERFFPPKFAWIDNNLLITTINDNQRGAEMLKLWDIRKYKDSSLNVGEITSIEIDKLKTSIFTPYINRELKLIYVIGKEKANIILYNYNEYNISKIKEYNIGEPSTCSVLFNRELLDINRKEIDRFAIYSKYNNIYNSSFKLTKESEISDSIFYPFEKKNILSYDQWIKGKNITIFENNNNNKETVNENNNNNDENEFKNINKNKQIEQKEINAEEKKIENENIKLYNDLINRYEKLKNKNKKMKEKNEKLKEENNENKSQLKLKMKENEEKQNKINELETKFKEEEKKYKELNNKYEQEKKQKEKLDKDLLEEKKKNENLINKNIYDELNIKYKELSDKHNNIEKLYEDLQKQLDEDNKNLKQKENEKNKMIENLNKQIKSLFDKNISLSNEKEKVIEEKDKLLTVSF